MFKPIDPSHIRHDTVEIIPVRKLELNGRRRMGYTEGFLRPVVYVERELQIQPGFDALMYHEGTHAYEYHSFAKLCMLAPAFLGFTLFLAFLWWPLLILLPVSAGLFLWWCREMEERADAVALYGAGEKSFRHFLVRTGNQRTRWGRWCYTPNISTRLARAHQRCRRHGWDHRKSAGQLPARPDDRRSPAPAGLPAQHPPAREQGDAAPRARDPRPQGDGDARTDQAQG